MERMAQSYPDEYEVQAFYALTLQSRGAEKRPHLRQ